MHGHSRHETTGRGATRSTLPETPIPGQPLYPETPIPGQPPYPETPIPGHPPMPGLPEVPARPPNPGRPDLPGQPQVPGVPESPLPGQPPVPETPPYRARQRVLGQAPWDDLTELGQARAALARERARRVQAEERAVAAEWRVTLLRGELMGAAERRGRWTWPWRRRATPRLW